MIQTEPRNCSKIMRSAFVEHKGPKTDFAQSFDPKSVKYFAYSLGLVGDEDVNNE